MPKFAANLSMLWPELDVYDRFRAAREAGFSRVEILFVHALDTDRLAELLKQHNLQLVLFDPAPGDWEAGERGMASNPSRQGAFRESITNALETAHKLKVTRLNVLTGVPTSPASAHDTIVNNLAWAAPLARDAGVTLLVENINNTDFPGYYVTTVQTAVDIVAAVEQPNVKVQFDQYHVGMMGQDARALIREYLAFVEHVQIADVPGRHEPGTGQQPIGEFLSDLDTLGYGGSVGLEYRPSADTESALTWLARDRRG